MLVWKDALILGTGIVTGYLMLTVVAAILGRVFLAGAKMGSEMYAPKRPGPGAVVPKENYGTTPGGVRIEAFGPQLVKPISQEVYFR